MNVYERVHPMDWFGMKFDDEGKHHAPKCYGPKKTLSFSGLEMFRHDIAGRNFFCFFVLRGSDLDFVVSSRRWTWRCLEMEPRSICGNGSDRPASLRPSPRYKWASFNGSPLLERLQQHRLAQHSHDMTGATTPSMARK